MKPFFVLSVFALAACGNYSNEDLDFQLALPANGELEASLPQALTLANSSEYYKLTRQVVTQFNGLAVALVSLVDHVRSYPPTSRNGAERIWGPFADDKHPGWQIRVVMQRLDDSTVSPPGVQIYYNLQIRNLQQSGSDFFDFMTGNYKSSGNARQGVGQMQLLVQTAREAGYPVDDFSDLSQLDLAYQTQSYPTTVHMDIQNVATATNREVIYDYTENADGSGQLIFDWTVDALPATPGATNVQFTSRWLGSGAGRADAYLKTGNVQVGTDCWDPSTVADYVWRVDQQGDLGTADVCVFPALI